MDPLNTAETPASPFTDDASRATWLEKGTVVPGDSADQPAASATADAGDPAASTDASRTGASEPPTPEKEKGASLKARNADLQMEIERNAELLRLRHEQRKALKESGSTDPTTPAATPASAPASVGLTQAEYKRYLAMPGAPKLSEFQEIEEHTAAMALFIGQQIAESTFDRKFGEISKTAAERDARFRSVNEQVTSADAAYRAYLERTPDADTRINPQLIEIVPASLLENPADAKPHNVLAEFVMTSGVPGEMHEYFSTPDGTKHWRDLLALAGQRDRLAFEFGKLSARFDSRAASPATPPKTVSTAPEPVTDLGKRPAKAIDDVETALLSGDPEAYQRAMNERDWAARRTA